MLIKKPVSEVFLAFIDPEITTKFWFTKSTGKLEKNKIITWYWETLNYSTDVMVEEIIEDRLIKFDWGGSMPKAEIEFTALDKDKTFVKIKSYGCTYSGKDLIYTIMGRVDNFVTVLDGLKVYLEYNIKLDLVKDKFPDGI
jgi:uncharacterized protein YndB with AHSA1/START domain